MATGADDLDEPPEEFGELLTAKPDRRIFYALVALVILMGVFVVYTSWQQKQADDARQEIVAAVRQQNKILLCYADVSVKFDLVLAEAVRTQNPPSSLQRAQLESAEAGLRDARTVCFGTVDRPVVPGTGTTVR
jgi:hypothetical protein